MSAADAIEPRSASLEISIYDPPQLQRLATRWFHLRPARRGKTNCPKGGSASIRTGCPSGPLRACPEQTDERGEPRGQLSRRQTLNAAFKPWSKDKKIIRKGHAKTVPTNPAP